MVSIIRKSSELIERNLFRIQYVSDLHLETNHIKNFESVIKPVAPYLALVGDIGHINHFLYEPFLNYVSNNFEKVFYVPGNHEFYSNSFQPMEEIEFEMKRLTYSFPNVHYMNRKNYKIDELNVGIIGTPLWTPHFSSKKIYINKKETLHPQYSNLMHQLDYTYIDEYCRRFARTYTSTVILTHFMPSYSLIPNKYQNYPRKENFASHSDFLFEHPIKCWIYGHTHIASSKFVRNKLALTNPFGYITQSYNNGFCNQMFAEFKLLTNEEEDKNLYKLK
jgi:predicted phosphodiesterase